MSRMLRRLDDGTLLRGNGRFLSPHDDGFSDLPLAVKDIKANSLFFVGILCGALGRDGG